MGAEAAAEDRDASPLPPPPPPQIGDRLPHEPAVRGAPEEFHPLPFHHPAGGAVIDSQHASAEKTSSDPATAGPHVIEEADGKAVDRALEAEAEVLLGGLMEAASTGPGTRGGARWRLISYGLLEVAGNPPCIGMAPPALSMIPGSLWLPGGCDDLGGWGDRGPASLRLLGR